MAVRLEPADEYMHELGPEPNFNESMYFNLLAESPTPHVKRLEKNSQRVTTSNYTRWSARFGWATTLGLFRSLDYGITRGVRGIGKDPGTTGGSLEMLDQTSASWAASLRRNREALRREAVAVSYGKTEHCT